jgi:predicted  nucleic acid-binding Zn-ribbon protein
LPDLSRSLAHATTIASPRGARHAPGLNKSRRPALDSTLCKYCAENPIETELAALRSRAETLNNPHAAADAALNAAKSNLQRHHLEADLDADDKVRAKLEAAIAAATLTCDGFSDAIAALQAKIADAERKLADERAAVERKAASEKLSRDVDAIERALPIYLEASRKLADALDEIHHHHETVQMRLFIDNTTAQVEVAGAFARQELRAMVNAIAEGNAPIPPANPQPAPVAVIEPGPPMQEAFMIKSAKYRAADGKMRYCGQYTDATMPAEIAQKGTPLRRRCVDR